MATDPFNAGTNCLAADAFLGGQTSGVHSANDLADTNNCTSNDIKIATAAIDSFSTNGGVSYQHYVAGTPIPCSSGTPFLIKVNATLQETANSDRADVGVWIATDGGNARTGTCNQYNLVTAANGNTAGGLFNPDGDNCAGISGGNSTIEPLGALSVQCPAAGDTLVHIGSCLAWQTPGQDGVCPQGYPAPSSENPNNYRFGTTPGNTAKCNCSGFNIGVLHTGTITIVKNTVGGNGTFSFTHNVGTNSNPTVATPFTITTALNTGSQLFDKVQPGTYTITESGPPAGWNFTSLSCTTGGSSSGQVATVTITNLGDNVTCTYTNTVQPGTLVIRKISNGGVGTFNFTSASAALPSPAVSGAFSLTTATAGTAVQQSFTVVPGTAYGVSESAKAGWTFDGRACVVTTAGDGTSSLPADGTTQPGSITVGAGATVTCTYTNTKQPSTLIIKKISNGGVGQFDFTSASAALPSPAVAGAFSLTTVTAGTAVQQSFTVVSGTAYGVSESAKAGWTFNGRACVVTTAGDGTSSLPADGTTQPGSITVGAGATVTCTYTNTLQPGTLVIRKISNDGVGTFNFTSASAALPTPAVAGAFSLTTVTAGTAVSQSFTVVGGTAYGVSESAKAGWTFNGRVCVVTTAGDGTSSLPTDGTTQPGSITVGAGATVTCTYTNTKQPGTLVIRKISNGGVETFNFTSASAALPSPAVAGAFSITTVTAGTAVSQSFTVVPGTAYGVSESAKTGWAFNGRACVVTTAGDGTSSLPADGTTQPASITVGAGATVTCTYTNTLLATLTLNKVENGGLPLSFAWGFELRTGTSTLAAGTLVASASANVTTGVVTFPGYFTPGSYNLCEVGMPVGYTNNFTGYTPLGATAEGGNNATECIDITLVSGANGPSGITGIPNPINNTHPTPSGAARTIGYWKNWSSCTGGNQYKVAQNILGLDKTLDFYLPTGLANSIYPFGAIVGPLTCAQAVNLLSKSDMNTGKKMASDPAYNLAAQLLAAKLNLAATGACADAVTAINAAQALLAAINFTGTGSYANKMTAQQKTDALALATTLDSFNNNLLCP